MTIEEARQAVLSFPDAYESEHHGHPDFRIKQGIFATLWPTKNRAVLRLPLELAESEAEQDPETFKLISKAGAGWLGISLPHMEADAFRALAEIAWRHRGGR